MSWRYSMFLHLFFAACSFNNHKISMFFKLLFNGRFGFIPTERQ